MSPGTKTESVCGRRQNRVEKKAHRAHTVVPVVSHTDVNGRGGRGSLWTRTSGEPSSRLTGDDGQTRCARSGTFPVGGWNTVRFGPNHLRSIGQEKGGFFLVSFWFLLLQLSHRRRRRRQCGRGESRLALKQQRMGREISSSAFCLRTETVTLLTLPSRGDDCQYMLFIIVPKKERRTLRAGLR